MKSRLTSKRGGLSASMAERVPHEFVNKTTDLKKLESSVKNKFKWSWLEEKDANGRLLSDYVKKLNTPGLALCLCCDTKLDYSKKGKSFIKRHGESAGHIKKWKDSASNQSLPAIFKGLKSMESGALGSNMELPDSDENEKAKPKLNPPSIKDRVAHQEAIICSFIAEHSLSLSMAPHLIHLARTLAGDDKALQSLAMERQTMTYKLKYGLHELERKRLVTKLCNTPFSLNIDESTAKHNGKRVLNILVCFFDSVLSQSVTHLYATLELTIVNATTVYEAVKGKLDSDGIPLVNLISILSDSAAYMRGATNGFQAKMREEAPHLLDIDGDMCHHMHNISKHFCQKIDQENTLARMFDDIHTDFQYSADIKDDFLTLCRLLNMEEQVPKERVAHRWLSMISASESFQKLKDPLTVLYYAWLSREDKELFKDQFVNILTQRKVTPAGRQTILRSILPRLRAKNMTELGRQRKKRIGKKLFDRRKEIENVLATILDVLPMFKKFILAFEHSKPMVHKLCDYIIDTFSSFLKLFVKPEQIRESGKKLAALDLSDDSVYLPAKHIEVGACSSVLATMKPPDVEVFREKLLAAFKYTAIYMQSKLPLSSELLKALSMLDPLAFGQSACAIQLKKLPAFLPNISSSSFDTEILAMQSDMDIPTGQEVALDKWWANVFALKRYPAVERIVSACLSVFTGPKVEASFSMMNNIITEKSAQMALSTYEAIQATKYRLISVNKTTCQLYDRPDKVHSPVDPSLAYHMQKAYSKLCASLKERKLAQAEKDKALGVAQQPVSSVTVKKRARKGAHDGVSSPPMKRTKQL